MNKESIIRAWKDPAYRASLSPEQRAELPEHPAGVAELDDATLGHAAGGAPTIALNAKFIPKQSAVDGCPSLFCPLDRFDIVIRPEEFVVDF